MIIGEIEHSSVPVGSNVDRVKSPSNLNVLVQASPRRVVLVTRATQEIWSGALHSTLPRGAVNGLDSV
jgi:hypothetical protein